MLTEKTGTRFTSEGPLRLSEFFSCQVIRRSMKKTWRECNLLRTLVRREVHAVGSYTPHLSYMYHHYAHVRMLVFVILEPSIVTRNEPCIVCMLCGTVFRRGQSMTTTCTRSSRHSSSAPRLYHLQFCRPQLSRAHHCRPQLSHSHAQTRSSRP